MRRHAPTVGLRPTTPATPAGAISCAVSVEVSVPIVSAARPAAVAAARPADEPAGVLSVSDGSSTWPPSERVALRHVRVEQAAELGDVRLAEHDRARRLELGHERGVGAGLCFCSAIEPPVVGSPCASIVSSSRTGMPCSGPRTPPAARSASSALASSTRVRVERRGRPASPGPRRWSARSASGTPSSASRASASPAVRRSRSAERRLGLQRERQDRLRAAGERSASTCSPGCRRRARRTARPARCRRSGTCSG